MCFYPSFGGGRSGAEMQPAMNLLKLFGERERSCFFFLVAVWIFGFWVAPVFSSVSAISVSSRTVEVDRGSFNSWIRTVDVFV